ncbi:hypothetical protein AQ490_24190 [Wenjunlia vitaminophila]|uniref:NB-ARC domain-containing protein n=1 Tax=Wenjunlia vitaminophila TaxID=76728 RepID=A0A0T6LRG8_WENVI|nr:hypothetical protein [Wenjunlia vitaminophila]KRV48640.1 hypothetical protein AQ490_24190 [Wenjunlia vitaminophila]
MGDPGGGAARLSNDLSGTVHAPVVQAGRVTGDVTIHHWQSPPQEQPPVPRQIPPFTSSFVNRTADLAGIDAALTPRPDRPVRLAVLSGLPGVGKSSTARHWAESARQRFPGGELYVDFAELRDRAGGDVSEGLRRCLRALGVQEGHIPPTLAERAALYRSRTAGGASMLVLLDDVTEPAQVTPLIPSAPGSAVLATSTGQLADLLLDGAELMPLDPLDAASGTRLLAERCSAARTAAEPEAVARLVELCAGLPIALHVAAARLITRPRMTVAALLGELTDEDSRLAAFTLEGESRVSAVFTNAYRQLPAEAAGAYRRLGLLPGRTFDLPAAAVACDTDPTTAGALLDALLAASLLEQEGQDRYRFHDLVRLHARSSAVREETESERHAVLRRVVDHYLVRAALADRALTGERLRITDHAVLLRGQADPFQGDPCGQGAGPDGQPHPGRLALAWLSTERANLLAVLRAATRHRLDEQAWRLAEAMCALYLHHRHLADWVEATELGAAAAHRVGQPAAEARLRALLSRPLLDLGQLDRAGRELHTAVELADASGHPVLRASVREFLGRYLDRTDHARAIDVYEQALALNQQAGEARGAALARYFLGCAQDRAGDPGGALTTLRRAHGELLALGDQRMAARTLAAVGLAQDHVGETAAAVTALEDAAARLEHAEAFHYQAQALEALADIAERAGDWASVRRHLRRAVEILAAGGSPRADDLRARLSAAPAQPDQAQPDQESRG